MDRENGFCPHIPLTPTFLKSSFTYCSPLLKLHTFAVKAMFSLRVKHFLLQCVMLGFPVAGQEDNLHAKKNYDKYLSALKNSGLVSVEEKAQGSADVSAGAEGGAGAMALLGKTAIALYMCSLIICQLLDITLKVVLKKKLKHTFLFCCVPFVKRTHRAKHDLFPHNSK